MPFQLCYSCWILTLAVCGIDSSSELETPSASSWMQECEEWGSSGQPGDLLPYSRTTSCIIVGSEMSIYNDAAGFWFFISPTLSLYLLEFIPALSLEFISCSLMPQTLVATHHFTPQRTDYKMAGTKVLLPLATMGKFDQTGRISARIIFLSN